MEKNVLQTKTKKQLQKPSMYMVLFHNDDYTTVEFVASVLMTVFQKSYLDAMHITMEVHNKGIALVGIYTYEVAQTSVRQVEILAEQCDYPFLATMEETTL
ncbi:ATP-dependent Clp protease adaptor ClpS [Candidatus Uabimicrobium amorphum]|uniref:ATP-dependent Clp protease adapter protein ClpS n=1 Tax=Uabimicrobium amorphum TaxID=2596890 RepID=A0A5S9IPE5_UABAM|nr:ATP-dependent Clp protease adaptor ClpS [Candidatus Uabimicrobium amorphum]BBM85454.1 ATP-dependent Clp protease adapter protein ClpS [Candidatus Uabimicrobium amorphum]